jgi:hypothetical protein
MFGTSGAVAGALLPGGILIETFATTLIGLLVVIVFGIQKFNEPTFEKNEDQPETQLPPHFLARPRQYVNALFFYLGSLSLLFVICAAVGSQGFGDLLGATPIKPGAFPLAMALIIVGFIPNVRWIQQIELFFRRAAHNRAFIPEGAQSMERRLRRAEFDFSKYNNPTRLNDEILRALKPTDFTAEPETIQRRWARFTCLIYALDQLYKKDGGGSDDFGNIAKDLDEHFLAANRSAYERLLARHRELRHRMASYRKKMPNRSDDDDLVEALRQALRRTHVLIGCAVLLKHPIDDRAIDALARFGFKVERLNPAPSIFYVIRSAALTMSALIFIAVMAAQVLGLKIPQGKMTPQQIAVSWALSSILVHGCAAWAAYKFWAHLKDTEWIGSPLQIFKAGVVGGFAGFIVLLPLDALFGPNEFDLKEVLRMLPWLLLPGTTGVFTAYFLGTSREKDQGQQPREAPIQGGVTAVQGGITALVTYLADRGQRLREAAIQVRVTAALVTYLVHRGQRLREAAIQGGVTALVTYLVVTALPGSVLPEAVLPDGQLSGTMEGFVIFITLLIGASLGFFLPHCHRELERAPSGEVQLRIGDVRWEANRVFHDQPKADEWLNEPNASLRGATPIAVATSAAGGDRVRNLLSEMQKEKPAKASRAKRCEAGRPNGRNASAVGSDVGEMIISATSAAAAKPDVASANGQQPVTLASPVVVPAELGH